MVNYQSLLLSQVFKSRAFNLTNSFSNPSLIKKRMIMMTKKRSGALVNLKLLMVLPVVAAVMVAFSSCGKNSNPEVTQTEIAPPPPPPPLSELTKEVTEESGEEPFIIVEEMPVFPGGNDALLKYIYENTHYPDAAKEKNIQGRVIIRFCVTNKGGVSNISVYKGVDPELDKEAMRVVKTLPAFKPGKQGGKPVPVWFILPITFALK
jgi:TonB family protein